MGDTTVLRAWLELLRRCRDCPELDREDYGARRGKCAECLKEVLDTEGDPSGRP